MVMVCFWSICLVVANQDQKNPNATVAKTRVPRTARSAVWGELAGAEDVGVVVDDHFFCRSSCVS